MTASSSRAHSEEVKCVREELVMEKEKELSKLQKLQLQLMMETKSERTVEFPQCVNLQGSD